MAKLERVTAKVFASDAPADKIGQFGSALAGTKLETGDVSTIQALPAYTEGWSSAVISQRNYPVLQETNGVMKNMSYQTAYIMQNGIAEYDPDTEYYTGSICKGIGNTNQYASWGDENVGNDVTNSQYWKNVTPVNYSNITNCLLEVPQRIKYTLENGTLTIKAGSVVIVPYGTEDLTAQYPVGSTFLNDNFKVYDTQFADGKFFVWAEIVNDIVRSTTTSSGDNVTRYVNIGFNINSAGYIGTSTTLDSGDTDPTGLSGYLCFYNTTKNLIGVNSGNTTLKYDDVITFPFAIGTTSNGFLLGSINQVFNGFGYIGSTVWVDKGVKGLIPNGRNEDGTCKNIEYINDRLKLTSRNTTGLRPLSIGNTRSILIGASPYTESAIPLPETGSGFSIYLNTSENIFYINNGTTWIASENFIVATLDMSTGGVINSLNAKQPFRAVDYSEFKEIVADFLVPDYAAGVSVSSGYTANGNGWLYIYHKNTGDGQSIAVSVDGTVVFESGDSGTWSTNLVASGFIFVGNGQQITYTGTGTNTLKFYPCKGGN